MCDNGPLRVKSGEFTSYCCQKSCCYLLPTVHLNTFHSDYQPVDVEVRFDGVRTCQRITSIEDTILENSEFFGVVLSTEDPDVSVLPDRAIITIQDDDGEASNCPAVAPYDCRDIHAAKCLIGYCQSLVVFCVVYAVLTIGFENTAYTTDEGETLEICVIRFGPLEREAIVRVTSREGSAEGTEYDIRKKIVY